MKYYFFIAFLCTFFISVGQNKYDITVKNINENTKNSDFGASYYGDKQIVYASARKKVSLIQRFWSPNTQPFLDLFIADIKADGGFVNATRFSKQVNSRYHEADAMFSKDGKKVYFTRSNYTNGHYGKDSLGMNNLKLYSASVENRKWKNIKELPFNNDAYSVGHPSLSEDEKTLFFVSDMPGSIGKTDIFKVAILGNDRYGTPENLGSMVNTVEKEMFPFVKGNELYFASEGHENNFGGLDLYVTKIYPTFILKPEHLQAPINTTADDFALIVNADYTAGYFSSNREEGKGDDDIYYFSSSNPTRFICKKMLDVTVKDAETGDLLINALVTLLTDKDVLVSRINLEEKITFSNSIDCNQRYQLIATNDGYINGTASIRNTGINEEVLNVVILLDKIVIEKPVVIDINPIYFDFDKYDVRLDAAIELDKVVAVMEAHPTIVVESGSHTDARGNDDYNLKLSAKRADATVAYIISKGIDASRISGRGYGETKLNNNCANGVPCTKKAHQLNRRTEFIVVK